MPPQIRPRRKKEPTKAITDNVPAIQALFEAVRNGDLKEVHRLLHREKISPNVRDPDHPLSPTPLLVAAEVGQYGIAQALLRNKLAPADVNAEDSRGTRPIWYAAKKDDQELAEILLLDSKDKCEVDYIDKISGCSPLYRAILSRAPEVCRQLLLAGADVNLRRLGITGDAASAETPLIKTVQMNNAEICDILINSHCDINASTQDGFTALHYAVAYRRYDIAEILLNNRVKLHKKSNNGMTSMTIAIDHFLPAMCRLLIQYGYDIDRVFVWEETPIEMAIRTHSEACALTLVNWGCRLKRGKGERSKLGSYFHAAASEGLIQLTKLMLHVNPLFRNEPWMRNQVIPFALYRKPELCDWLFGEAKRPPTLVEWCFVKIRLHLGKHPCSKIDKLDLPPKILKQMEYGDCVPEKMYRQTTIDAKECPYDCVPDCFRPQCPDIDFSDSGSEYSEED